VGLPVVLLPARLRRFYETWVMMLLAGTVAVDLHAGRGEPVPAVPAGPVPEPVPELPAREAAMLAQAGKGGYVSDVGQAWKILGALHGGDDKVAGRHLAYLESECEGMLGCTRARAMTRALAGALLACRTLPAAAWQAVLREAA
jgi:hypothetical protein